MVLNPKDRNQLVIQFDKGGIKGYNHYINIIELEI